MLLEEYEIRNLGTINENVFNSSDSYKLKKRLLAYLKGIKKKNIKTEDAKILFDSAFSFLYSDYKHWCDSFEQDIKELDACFSVKAYKATLILAGSILEAFLLDWLSEKDGKNYFKQPYKVAVTDKNGKVSMEKKEQLSVYIDQIKEIERPDWMDPSEKAHFIRRSRNSVHAKVCLKEEIDINEETCSKVISYLTEIINSRMEKRKSELSICDDTMPYHTCKSY